MDLLLAPMRVPVALAVTETVTAPEPTSTDTYADEDLFSYRRTCHRGEPDYGRNLSVIALTEQS